MDIMETCWIKKSGKAGEYMSANFKTLRLNAGFATQTDLAKRLGVSNRTVNNWENGKNYPKSLVLPVLAEELEVGVGDIIESINNSDKTQNYK